MASLPHSTAASTPTASHLAAEAVPATQRGSTPRLAPPGAGLPFVELQVARVLFALARRRGTREAHSARFQRERQAIARALQPFDDHARARRVLIRRPPGLEDSSRHWSLWMTLDHLRIVNVEIARVVTALAHDRVPEGQSSTAAVKPSPAAGADVVPAYEQSCDALLAAVAAPSTLRTRLRFAHPWFGPLDAAGWHALSATHMAIHRVQVERIAAGLGAGGAGDPAEVGSSGAVRR